MPLPPPTPAHTLRTHAHAITNLFFSSDNERLYAGDASGTVSVTSTRTLRPIAKWKPHEESILGVEEWVSNNANGSVSDGTVGNLRKIIT